MSERPDVFADRIGERWIAAFGSVFGACSVERRGEVAILSETQSRRLNAALAALALLSRRARTFHVTVVSPPQTAPVPVRSTGASPALQGLGPAVKALSASACVVDLSVEGMLHGAAPLRRVPASGKARSDLARARGDALALLLDRRLLRAVEIADQIVPFDADLVGSAEVGQLLLQHQRQEGA